MWHKAERMGRPMSTKTYKLNENKAVQNFELFSRLSVVDTIPTSTENCTLHEVIYNVLRNEWWHGIRRHCCLAGSLVAFCSIVSV